MCELLLIPFTSALSRQHLLVSVKCNVRFFRYALHVYQLVIWIVASYFKIEFVRSVFQGNVCGCELPSLQ